MAREAETADSGRGHVLVVDDEPGVVEVVRRILEGAGWQVSSAVDADGAVTTAARASDLDAVLLDLSLPDRSGVAVLADLAGSHPGLPVLLSSGLSEGHVLDQHGTLAYAAYVPKPFRPAELIAALETVLGGRQQDMGAA